MRDLDIRQALKQELGLLHSEEPDTLILDELGLCQGRARVDIAVVNGAINGFEIKSERDTLDRLPSQQDVYNRTLDFVTIVASGQHIKRIIERVPNWWGIKVAKMDGETVVIEPLREPRRNTEVDPIALAQLLWRDELLEVLTELGIEKGMLSKPRKALWRRLAEHLTVVELGDIVRQRLKIREGWRSDP